MPPFKRLLIITTKPWFVIIFVLLNIILFMYVDRPLAEYITEQNFRMKFASLSIFTRLGLGIIYLIAFLAAALFFRYVRVNKLWESRFWFLWLAVLTTGSICVFFKVLLGRARPNLWFMEKLYGFYGIKTQANFWSLPSGHTTTIMAIAFGLCIIFPRYCLSFIGVGFFIALTRVFLVHHYMSDILISSYISLLEIGLLAWFLQNSSWLKPIWKDNTLIANQRSRRHWDAS